MRLFFSGMFMMWPYLVLHMLDLGLDTKDVGNINALLPFVTFFASPVLGMISIDLLGAIFEGYF